MRVEVKKDGDGIHRYIVTNEKGTVIGDKDGFEIMPEIHESAGCLFAYDIDEQGFTLYNNESGGVVGKKGEYKSQNLEVVDGLPNLYMAKSKEGMRILQSSSEKGYNNKISVRAFDKSGFAFVPINGLTYVINKDLKIIDPKGFEFVESPLANLFVVQKRENGPYFIIDDKNRSFGEFKDFEDAIKKRNNMSKTTYLTEGTIEDYLDGKLDVRDLPDECFEGKNLETIIANEKRSYEYNLNMAKIAGRLKDMERIQKDAEANAEYIKSRTYEVELKKASILENAEGDGYNLF